MDGIEKINPGEDKQPIREEAQHGLVNSRSTKYQCDVAKDSGREIY